MAVFSTQPHERDGLEAVLAGGSDSGEARLRYQYGVCYYEERLDLASAAKAAGCDAVCVSAGDDCGRAVVRALARAGVRMLLVRGAGPGFPNVDLDACLDGGITIARLTALPEVPFGGPDQPGQLSRRLLALLTPLDRHPLARSLALNPPGRSESTGSEGSFVVRGLLTDPGLDGWRGVKGPARAEPFL